MKLINHLVFLLIKWYMFRHVQEAHIQKIVCLLYQHIARQQFIVKSDIVRVKKGKRRYRVSFIETPDYKTKVYIRKWTDRVVKELN